jgi:hypothetical protein
MSFTPFRGTLTYLGLMPVAAIAAIFSQYLAISVLNQLPRDWLSEWVGWPINVIPSAAAGFLVYQSPARRAIARGRAAVEAYLLRTAPLYVGIILLAVWISLGMREPGFGLVAQLLLWPLAAFLGGLLADFVAGRRASASPAAA